MDQDPVQQLNVGGSLYTTSLSVLTKDTGSELHKLFSGNNPNKVVVNGHVFIDRDGQLFRYILNFLRDDELIVPLKFAEFDLLLAEAEYYNLQPLKRAIREKLLSRADVMEFVILRYDQTSQIYRVEATKTTAFALHNQFGTRFQIDPNANASDVIQYAHRDNSLHTAIKAFLLEFGFIIDKTSGKFFRYR